jgi:CheY-like chemotaxis protein
VHDIFLVEDDAIIRMMIAQMVEELDHCVVAEAGRIEVALPLAEHAAFDLAISDINIGGLKINPVAEIVQARGLPLLFASGYGPPGVPESFKGRPALRKPFQIEELGKAIDSIFSP